MQDLKLQETKDGVLIEVFVKPNSKQFKITLEQDGITVFCQAPPSRNKANKELIKELSKTFHVNVEIVAGATSRQKRLLLRGITAKEFRKTLSQH